jgi:hypothetical protein
MFNSIIFSLAIPDEDIENYCKKNGKEFIRDVSYSYLLNLEFKQETASKFKVKEFNLIATNIIPEISEDSAINIKSPEISNILTVQDDSVRNRLDEMKFQNYDEDIKQLKHSLEKIKKSIAKYKEGEKISLIEEGDPEVKRLTFGEKSTNEEENIIVVSNTVTAGSKKSSNVDTYDLRKSRSTTPKIDNIRINLNTNKCLNDNNLQSILNDRNEKYNNEVEIIDITSDEKNKKEIDITSEDKNKEINIISEEKNMEEVIDIASEEKNKLEDDDEEIIGRTKSQRSKSKKRNKSKKKKTKKK